METVRASHRREPITSWGVVVIASLALIVVGAILFLAGILLEIGPESKSNLASYAIAIWELCTPIFLITASA